jgi:polar amino acid transport system substrate-binding protein
MMRTRLLLLLAVLSLAIAACGGDPDPFGVGSNTDGTTGGDATTTTEAGDETTTTTAGGGGEDTTTTGDTPDTTAFPPSPLMEQIAASGVLRVGVYSTSLLPLVDPDLGTGFEPDLAREIADRLFGNIDVQFVPLTAAERFNALADGSIDILIRGTAHTTSRDELAAFSIPYLLDGIVVVVNADSGRRSPEDLDGSSLAVLAGTTLEVGAVDLLDAAGVEADLIRVDQNVTEPFAAGTVDGYVSDWTFATIAVYADPGLRIIWLAATDPIAAAVPLGDRAYVTAVTAIIREIVEDGTWDQLTETWFPGRIPWTKREMLRRQPSNR